MPTISSSHMVGTVSLKDSSTASYCLIQHRQKRLPRNGDSTTEHPCQLASTLSNSQLHKVPFTIFHSSMDLKANLKIYCIPQREGHANFSAWDSHYVMHVIHQLNMK